MGRGGGAIQFTPVVVHESQEAVKVRRRAPCIYSLVCVILFTLFTLPNLLNSTGKGIPSSLHERLVILRYATIYTGKGINRIKSPPYLVLL